MENNFLTREDVIQAFNMDKNISNDDILKILKEKIKECHPDKIEGREEEAKKITSAMDCINKLLREEQNGNALVPIQILSQTIVKLSEEITKISLESNRVSLEQRTDTFVKSYKSGMTIPAISSSALLGILSFIFMFPSAIVDNPLLSNIELYPYDKYLLLNSWFLTIIITSLFWIFKYTQESYFKNAITSLRLENNRNIIFDNFLKEKALENIDNENKTSNIEFIDTDFLNYACRKVRSRHRGALLSKIIYTFSNIHESLANSGIVNDLIKSTLEKFVSKGILSKAEDELIFDKYIVNPDYIKSDTKYV